MQEPNEHPEEPMPFPEIAVPDPAARLSNTLRRRSRLHPLNPDKRATRVVRCASSKFITTQATHLLLCSAKSCKDQFQI